MQLLPATAASLGVNPHNVADNIRGGLHYLHAQLRRFGDAAQALAAYNWGPGHVAHAVARWGSDWLNHAPEETKHYVASILSRSGMDAPTMSGQHAILAVNQSDSLSAAGSHLAGPTSAAQRAQLRSALSAYFVSEILGGALVRR
jgi:hypothetical protein